MSCPGIPLNVPVETPCQYYQCQDGHCDNIVYVFAQHWFKNGQILRGASGAFVPAVTVCQLGIATERIGRARFNPGYKYFGL